MPPCDAAETQGLDPAKIVVSYHAKGKPPRTFARRGQRQRDRTLELDGRSQTHGTGTHQPGRRVDPAPEDTAMAPARTPQPTGLVRPGSTILRVATSGMATGNMFDNLPDTLEKIKITGLSQDDLQVLTKSKAVLTTEQAIQQYAESVVSLAEKAALSRDVFLIMSFEETDDLEDYRAAVKEVCQKAGFQAVRTDSRPAGQYPPDSRCDSRSHPDLRLRHRRPHKRTTQRVLRDRICERTGQETHTDLEKRHLSAFRSVWLQPSRVDRQ